MSCFFSEADYIKKKIEKKWGNARKRGDKKLSSNFFSGDDYMENYGWTNEIKDVRCQFFVFN